MFVLLGTYARPLSADDRDVVEAHRSYLDARIEEGQVLCSGPRVPRVGGVIVALGSDPRAAEEIARADPLVHGGLAAYEIVQFVAAKSGSPCVPTEDAPAEGGAP